MNQKLFRKIESSGNGRENGRDLSLDFTKGILVIVMVVYHTLNVFSMATSMELGYLRFVTGSFIFISGYIISTFYEKRLTANQRDTSIRLLIRGFKLLAIFTFLNLTICITGIGNPGKCHFSVIQFIKAIPLIYIFGAPGISSFQILLPIAYLLILSPVIMMLSINIRYTALIVLIVTILSLSQRYTMVVTGLIVDGLVGMLMGHSQNKNIKYVISNIYVLIILIIAIMFSMNYLGMNRITYILSIIVFLKVTHDIAPHIDANSVAMNISVLFGQYTLVCYILQIIFLRGLSILLEHRKWAFGYELISIFFVTNAFLLALCMLLGSYRRRSKTVDRAYRLILA